MRPTVNHRDPVSGAISELIETHSALNMPATPRPAEQLATEPFDVDYGNGAGIHFLTTSDVYVNHARDHLVTAIDHLRAVQEIVADMRRIAELTPDPVARSIASKYLSIRVDNRIEDVAHLGRS